MSNKKGNQRIRFTWERQLRGSPLDAYTKAIGLILATYCIVSDSAYPSVATLAKKADLSPKRTRALLHNLAKEHWVSITFGGEQEANTYHLTTPKYAELFVPERAGTIYTDAELKNDQRFVWERAVLDSEVLDFAQKSMALVLATYETNLVAVPSIEQLAEASSRSRRRVYQLLRDLSDGGWLKVTTRGRNRSNLYELTMGSNKALERLRSLQNPENECATGGRGVTDGTEEKIATGEQLSVPPAGNECATGEPERATGGSLRPVVIPVNKNPLANSTSSATRKGVSDDEKEIAEAILLECDRRLGPAFANSRREMKDQLGMARMITQLLASNWDKRDVIEVITEDGYANTKNPAHAAHKRLSDYARGPEATKHTDLPRVTGADVDKMWVDVLETMAGAMRKKTNATLGLRDRKVPIVEYVDSALVPSFDELS